MGMSALWHAPSTSLAPAGWTNAPVPFANRELILAGLAETLR